MKISRYDAPVPVKPRKGREVSELTKALNSALDDIISTGASQRYTAESTEEQNRVAVRVRQLAAKRSLPLSVARVAIDGKPCVVFGPRGDAPRVNGHEHSEDTQDQLKAIMEQLAKLTAQVGS
jgi:hypothetical protein